MRKKQIFMIFILIASIISLSSCLNQDSNEHKENNNIMEDEEMKIKITNDQYEIFYSLNDSKASKLLYKQLPIDTVVENYGSSEKIFYPPQALEIQDTPLLKNGRIGTLGYFAPWNNVVMYYGSCEAYAGLYILGEAIKGGEYIKNLSGTLHIEKIETL